MSEHAAAEEWWDGFYDDAIAELLLVRHDPGELAAALAFLTSHLAIGKGTRVFDQCCGIGSLSIPLAERGARVFGVDLCEAYIQRARSGAARLEGLCTFAADDAFLHLPRFRCRAAFNWYSSFGYSADDARNRQMLARAFESLEPGGRFALDVPNMIGLARHFRDCMVRHSEAAGRPALLVRESELDLSAGFLRQWWTWAPAGGPQVVRHSALRLYLPHQIAAMLEDVGFRDVTLFGGLGGEPLSPDTLRCLATAVRP